MSRPVQENWLIFGGSLTAGSGSNVLKAEWVFSSLKSINNRLTRHSRSGKHGRLGHVIEKEKCHVVAR